MGKARLAEELRDRKRPRARAVAGRSAGLQFSPPLGDCRVGPGEGTGDLLQLPGKGKGPDFSPLDPIQGAVAVVQAGQQNLRARADRERGDPVKERIKVVRPDLPKDVSLLHLPAIFLALARHGRRLTLTFQQIGVEGFYAQGINQQRAAAPSLSQNLDEGLPPACPIESTLTDAWRAQDPEELRLGDRQGPAPVDDNRRRWGLPSLHNPNRNTKRRIVNRIYAV